MNRQILTNYSVSVRDLLNDAMARTDSGDSLSKFRERVRTHFDGLTDRGSAILKVELPVEDADSDVDRCLEDIEVSFLLNSTFSSIMWLYLIRTYYRV